MRDLGNIRALNNGIEKTFGPGEVVQRIVASVGDGQLLRECLRRGLLVDDRVSDKGLDALRDVLASHGIKPDASGLVALDALPEAEE